jgi:hypothetical protein
LSHTSSPFCCDYFGDGVSKTICLGWPQTVILLILASQGAKITGMNNPAKKHTFKKTLPYPHKGEAGPLYQFFFSLNGTGLELRA